MAETKTKVITGKVRFSYAHVFEPTAINESSEKKYSVSLIIPKSDKKSLAKIEAAVKAAIEDGKAKFGGKIPNNLKLPLRDGDAERPDDDNYKNSMFINASSMQKPGIVDADLNPIMNKDDFYSGCYGRASVNFYAFSVSGNKGIAAGLNNLQKTEDGERLAGGASAEEDFGSDNDDDLM
jgi:hypothetical protein